MERMKYIIILIFITSNFTICFCQIDSVTFYFNNLKYKEAERILRKRLNVDNYKNNIGLKQLDYYNLACVYACQNNTKLSLQNIKSAIKIDSNLFESIITDPDFYSIQHSYGWIKLIKDNVVLLNLNLKDTIVIALSEICINDQAFRYELDFNEKKYGLKSSKVLKIWNKKDSLNKKNLEKLEYYLSKGVNCLSDSLVGNRIAGKCFLVIQHSDFGTMEKYLPVIENLYRRKQTDGQNYALLYDRVSLNKNKGIQYYGTQVNPATNYLYPIKDEKNVDKRRAELGLMPIKDYLLMMNIIYDPKRKK